jgi:Tfp pilus assembly protein PilF
MGISYSTYFTNNKKEILVCVLLFALTFSIYWTSLDYPFIDYDDPEYILENIHIQKGLNWASIKWAITNYYASNWHPTTWISHIIDYQFYGLNPSGHHLTNVLLHSINSILFFLAFYLLTQFDKKNFDTDSSIFFSALVAVIFSIHPLRVESVAWISERKDLLSGFFAALLLISYSFYVKQPSIKFYLILLVAFSLGLMSKPMLVTFPFVLFLLDFWPLKRFSFLDPDKKDFGNNVLKLALEKIPLLGLSLFSSLITLYAQKAGSSVISLESLPLESRIFNSIISYTSYLEKFFLPLDLCVLYPYSLEKVTFLKVFFAFLFLAIVTLVAIKFISKYSWLIVGWLWYLGTLIPVIGIVQVGNQSMADRYSYLPLIGINIIVCNLITLLTIKYPQKKLLVNSFVAIIGFTLFILSIVQLDTWRNSEALAYQALKVNPNNETMHFMLANELIKKNDLPSAKDHLQKAIDVAPTFAKAYNSLGIILAKEKNFTQAIEAYKQALNYDPSLAATHCNLGILYNRVEDYPKAIESFQKAIKLDPNLTKSYFHLSISYLKIKDKRSAMEQYKVLESISPAEANKLLPVINN